MQSTQKQGTSTGSRSAMTRERFHEAYPEKGLSRSREYEAEASEVKPFLGDDKVVDFETFDSSYFHAEYTERGDDIIYHFWPPGEDGVFPEGFLTHVQEAFRKCLPPDFSGRVAADYTNHQEATVHHMHGVGAVPKKDMSKDLVIPRETVYVRVPGAMRLPLADVFLKGRVFRTLEDEFRGDI